MVAVCAFVISGISNSKWNTHTEQSQNGFCLDPFLRIERCLYPVETLNGRYVTVGFRLNIIVRIDFLLIIEVYIDMTGRSFVRKHRERCGILFEKAYFFTKPQY
jgi:hypothetical protein